MWKKNETNKPTCTNWEKVLFKNLIRFRHGDFLPLEHTFFELQIAGFNKQSTPAIGFHVALSHDMSTARGDIGFNVVLHHYGNCWNGAIKKFVAPVTGMYSFQLTIMNHNNKVSTWVQLMHGNQLLQRAYADGHGNHHQTTASAVVKVNKGEQVYGRLERGILHSNAFYWCNFVGFLVKKM